MSDQQLLDYIKQQLVQGVSKEVINNNLLSQGWQQQDVIEAFSAAENQNTTVPQTPQILSDSRGSNLKINLMTVGFGFIMWLAGFIFMPEIDSALAGLAIIAFSPIGLILSYVFTAVTFLKERPYIILFWPFLYIMRFLIEAVEGFGDSESLFFTVFIFTLYSFSGAVAFYRKKRKISLMADGQKTKNRWAIVGFILVLFGAFGLFYDSLFLDHSDLGRAIFREDTPVSIASMLGNIFFVICVISGIIFSLKGLKSSKQGIAIVGIGLGLLIIGYCFFGLGYAIEAPWNWNTK